MVVEEQVVHAWPPTPHALSEVPATQVFPMQQPEQLELLHVGGGLSQMPALQTAVLPQFMHTLPPAPHAVDEVPETHVLPEQQPEQLDGPQVSVQ